jgi:intein/homing endonuclease
MGDLTLQDEIFDGNGKLTKIKNISEVHYNPCYKLTFDTNDTLIADHEHRWVVIKNNEEVIMTTEEINQYNTLNKDKKRLKIELCPLECEEQDLEIDPYLLGLWLGDGNRTCGTITIENNDIIDGLKSRGHVLSSNHSRNNDKAASYTIYGLAKHLRKLGLIGNKHIPDKYLRGSYEQRLLLLQGFMDADGYFNPIRNRCYTSTTKLWQVESFMTLVSSLGLKPTMNRFKTSGFGKTNIEAFSTEFTGSINPFLFRNKNIKLSDNKRTKYRYINKAELIETVPTKCLEVESESHTYLAGKTYIKTHNTNCEIKTSNKYENFFEPISHLQVCEYTKYSLQLSLYAWMLEQFGYEIDHIEFIHHTLDDNNKSIASKIYKCPYLKDEIEKMLEHYKNSF